MYQPMLFVHWKQARLFLIPFVVAAFALPLLVVQGAGGASGETYRVLGMYQAWLPFFPLLAGTTGAMLALTAWNWDHRFGHVYALSLPLARWQYTMLKMGAGLALALVPTAAMWLGAELASASVTLPEGLHAYPGLLTLRFFLAILITYALFFAMAAGNVKTTVWVLTGVLLALLMGNVLNEVFALYFPVFQRFNMVEATVHWLTHTGGPFEVFTGNWTLIDV